MKKIELPIIVGKGAKPFLAVAYEPFDGAPFVAQKSGRDWLITHRASTFWIGHEVTRGKAIDVAEALAHECPSARKVRAVSRADGTFEKLIGPHRKLRTEIAATGLVQLRGSRHA